MEVTKSAILHGNNVSTALETDHSIASSVSIIKPVQTEIAKFSTMHKVQMITLELPAEEYISPFILDFELNIPVPHTEILRSPLTSHIELATEPSNFIFKEPLPQAAKSTFSSATVGKINENKKLFRQKSPSVPTITNRKVNKKRLGQLEEYFEYFQKQEEARKLLEKDKLYRNKNREAKTKEKLSSLPAYSSISIERANFDGQVEFNRQETSDVDENSETVMLEPTNSHGDSQVELIPEEKLQTGIEIVTTSLISECDKICAASTLTSTVLNHNKSP